jgi:haloalkane dehalogenase
MPDIWWQFREVVCSAPKLEVSRLVQAGCQTTLAGRYSPACDAWFPDDSVMAGVRSQQDIRWDERPLTAAA